MMKLFRILPLALLLSTVLALQSCNEEIDFTGDDQKTAIVFGLLNQADSIHYIKITRAFSGSSNALEAAQIPDSSYFPVMTATVSENGTANKWVLRDTVLNHKLPGVFYSPGQKVYYFKAALNPEGTYKLDVNVNNDEYHVYGETKLVTGVNLSNPTSNGAFIFAGSNPNSEGYKSTSVIITKGTSDVINCRLEVFINEFINGAPVEKSFLWSLGELSGSQLAASTTFTANGKSFYQFVKDNVTNDPTIIKRQFSRLKVHITAGSEDLSRYILANKPSTTLSQSKPSYTNLTATNEAKVIGLFSSRVTVTVEKQKFVPSNPGIRGISQFSIKELCKGSITGALSFCSDNPDDQLQNYFCN